MTSNESNCIWYTTKRFGDDALALIGQANVIIDEYVKRGYPLTLRQLYYQFVSRDLLPNKIASYNRLGSVISDARLAGLVSWTAIEDRGRNLMGLRTVASPADAIRAARDSYRLDLWADQRYRPEVWVEKQALEGVIAVACNRLRIDYYATKGYDSQSQAWRAGQRMAQYVRRGQRPVVFHLGDHDPSGIDMTRDIGDRLTLFTGVPVMVVRLALNRDQVDRYDPPPNPAKMTDSRAAAYVEEHGESSWELDALNPEIIHGLIEDAVSKLRDEDAWSAALAREAADKTAMDDMMEDL
jgi:hypothetical protein